MKVIEIHRRIGRNILWISLSAALLQSVFGVEPPVLTLSVLKTKTGEYTNVTVTTKAKDHIFISYPSGMATIKVTDLSPETAKELGYVIVDPSKPKTNAIAAIATEHFNRLNQNLRPIEDKLRDRWAATPPKTAWEVIYSAVIVLLMIHLLFAYCCHLICVKAKRPNSALVWFPVLQFIPLLRAAGMSGWWVLGMFVPVLNLVAYVLWAARIPKARDKSAWVTVFLLLPVTSFFAFLYLALSSGGPKPAATDKRRSFLLQTA